MPQRFRGASSGVSSARLAILVVASCLVGAPVASAGRLWRPATSGAARSVAAASAASPASPASPGEALGRALAASGADGRALARCVRVGSVPFGPSGARRVVHEQRVAGVPVFRGAHDVVVREDGSVFAVRLGDVADPGEPGPFLLDAEQAARIADAAVAGGLDVLPDEAFAPRGAVLAARDVAAWRNVGLGAGPAPAPRRAAVVGVILPDGPTAAWRVELFGATDATQAWCVLVDATSGAVVDVLDRTRHAVGARVYPGGFLAGPEWVELVDGREVIDLASPDGWLFADETEGPNSDVQEDREGDQGTTPGARARSRGEPPAFDFDVTGDPAIDLDAALTNAFWAVNHAHDRFHALGWNEARGAIQREGYGRGGEDGDTTRVYVQYQAGDAADNASNNASAYAAGDGGYTRLTFGVWDRSGEIRDAALDTSLVFHEYAHLAVHRLVGNDPACDNPLQSRSLAEGWADYFAAAWTGDPVFARYVSGDDASGLRTKSLDENSYTIPNFCGILGGCNATRDGEIWAGLLWDLRAAMIAAYGEREGARRADELVVHGMALTPCDPTLPDARDALAAAADLLNDSVDHCLAWSALRGRGFGASLRVTDADDEEPLPGWDVPVECEGGARAWWGRAVYGDDADARLLLGDASDHDALRSVEVTTPGGDVETFDLAPAGTLVRSRLVPLRAGPIVPGDGVVQVADGEEIAAHCLECPSGEDGRASIRVPIDVVIQDWNLQREECHVDRSDADVSEWSGELHSLLDAGEVAELRVTAGNAERFALEDVSVEVISDHPDVVVLPSGPVPVADVAGRDRDSTRIDRVSLKVWGAPSLAAGATELRVVVRARGHVGEERIRLHLASDYLAERGVSAFDGGETFETGSATAPAWTHSPGGGLPADQWSIQDCGDGQGRAMGYTGDACADYSDEPAAALVVSAPVFDLASEVVHQQVRSLSWRHDVHLGVDPDGGRCDNEHVYVFATSTSDALPLDEPDALGARAFDDWTHQPDRGTFENTGGWVDAGPGAGVDADLFGDFLPGEARLAWAFLTDVDDSNQCDEPPGLLDAVGGGYRLDDVHLVHDAVRVVPAAMGCDATCAVFAHLSVTPFGLACPGDELVLDATLSEGLACPSGLQYRFTGPDFDTGYQGEPLVVAPAAADARWQVAVRCADDTGCDHSMSLDLDVRDRFVGGFLDEDSLRLERSGADVALRWRGSRAPPAYAVVRADVDPGDPAARLTEIARIAAAEPDPALRVGWPETDRWHQPADEGGPLSVYVVTTRLPCDAP